MVAENLAFAALALVMVIGGIQVVTTQNVVRAALYLVVVLAGVAAIYILLAAEFVVLGRGAPHVDHRGLPADDFRDQAGCQRRTRSRR